MSGYRQVSLIGSQDGVSRSSQVVCTHPGSPYKQSYGNRQSPDCGHVYEAPADYTVTATTYWEVTWAGAGQSGQIPLQLSSSTQITIGELQVLIQ